MKHEQHTRIASVMRSKGVSFTELAARLGKTIPTVHGQVYGNPSINTLAAIAGALDCPLIDLIATDGE